MKNLCAVSKRWSPAVFALVVLVNGLTARAAGSPSPQPPNPAWSRVAELGVSRLFPGVEVVDGRIIIFGGFTRIAQSHRLLAEIETFDPASRVVSRKADMPSPRGFFGSAVVDGRIYVIGGYDSSGPSARVEVYDPATETWTSRASLNVARGGLRAAHVGGKIYAFGGFLESATIIEVYDTTTDSWTRLEDMRQPILNPSVAVHDDLIYVVGGGIPDGTKAAGFVEVLDPRTATWRSLTTMPVPKGDHIVGIHQGRLFVVGGWNDVIVKTIEVYDLAGNTWSTRPDLDDLRFYHGGAVIDGRFYIIAGARGDTAVASEYTNTIDVYDPLLD